MHLWPIWLWCIPEKHLNELGRMMREYKPIALVSMIALSLSACIPAGSGDYRIPAVRPSPTEENPQIVPEDTVIMPTPSWSPAVVDRNLRDVNGGNYVVKQGDTLYRIVSETGASLAAIAAANNLEAPYALRIGQVLVIPGGRYHNVSTGETGIAIARAYGVNWTDIVSLNALPPPYLLKIGQRLRLPESVQGPDNATNVPGGTPEQNAASFSLNIDDIVTGGEPALQLAEGVTDAPPPRAVASLTGPIARPGSFSGSFAWPLRGNVVSRFGSKGGGKVNDGLNIAAANGTPVYASSPGVVVYSGNEIGVYGGLVLIDHGDGWITAYGHLGKLTVGRGDRVIRGQTIGTVGDTGYVSTPQLHFEIRKDRKPVDPAVRLPV
jgi:murein DD-endopeptidase MepM/ murein hydrolase activator NlpD